MHETIIVIPHGREREAALEAARKEDDDDGSGQYWLVVIQSGLKKEKNKTVCFYYDMPYAKHDNK